MLYDRPLRIHLNVIFIGQQPGDIRTQHLLVDQQRFGGTICCEDLEEELLDVGLADFLHSHPNFLGFNASRLVLPTNTISTKNFSEVFASLTWMFWANCRDCGFGPLPPLLAEDSLESIETVSLKAESLSGESVRPESVLRMSSFSPGFSLWTSEEERMWVLE